MFTHKFISVVFNWLWLASSMVLGVTAQAALNDTGIKTCSNETENGLSCPVDGFTGQDAEFGTNSFDFTKLDAAGNELPVTATNHVCVKDNVTGLMWEVKTDDDGLRDKDWTYTWYNSNSPDGNPGTASGGTCATTGRCDTEKFVADVNVQGLCGHNDWRMPNPQELASIVDYSIPGPNTTIDINFFPNSISNAFFGLRLLMLTILVVLGSSGFTVEVSTATTSRVIDTITTHSG